MTEPDDALAQAPLLRVVRERHPDVDVVVLPPGAPAPEASDAPVPVTAAALEAERSRVQGVLAGLLAAAGATVRDDGDGDGDGGSFDGGSFDGDSASGSGSGSGDEPVTTWRSAPASTVVPVAEARIPIDSPDAGIAVGRALSARLRADGWDGRLDHAGATPLLIAGLDDRSVRVAWLDDVVLLTVRGRDLPVATATARALVSGAEDAR